MQDFEGLLPSNRQGQIDPNDFPLLVKAWVLTRMGWFCIHLLKSLVQASEEAALSKSSCCLPQAHYSKETTRQDWSVDVSELGVFHLLLQELMGKKLPRRNINNLIFSSAGFNLSLFLSARMALSGGPQLNAVTQSSCISEHSKSLAATQLSHRCRASSSSTMLKKQL